MTYREVFVNLLKERKVVAFALTLAALLGGAAFISVEKYSTFAPAAVGLATTFFVGNAVTHFAGRKGETK